MLYPMRRGETRTAWAARLTARRVPCQCGCGEALRFDRSDVDTRTLFRRGHAPMPAAAIRRRVTVRWTRGAYSHRGSGCRGWWTAERRAARAAQTRRLWQAGVWRAGGGIRAELLRRFPECGDWVRSLTDADLDGLLSRGQERAGDGVAPSHALRKLLFGDSDDGEAERAS
jgi:hypothetical protein